MYSVWNFYRWKVNFTNPQKRNQQNTIAAYERPDSSRPRSSCDILCQVLNRVWDFFLPSEILGAVFIMGDIAAGYEQDFMWPEA